MRVTAQVKLETQQAILAAARELFVRQGLEATSTRAIAARAGIGVGTLFNYYPSKESLAMEIAQGAFEAGREWSAARLGERAPGTTLEEDLFTLVACDLRALAPIRRLVGELLQAGGVAWSGVREGFGAERLADVERVLALHDMVSRASGAMLHLYWSLYLGVLSFWAGDPSPHQEDTLALLDQGVRMFAGAVRGAPGEARRAEDQNAGLGPRERTGE